MPNCSSRSTKQIVVVLTLVSNGRKDTTFILKRTKFSPTSNLLHQTGKVCSA